MYFDPIGRDGRYLYRPGKLYHGISLDHVNYDIGNINTDTCIHVGKGKAHNSLVLPVFILHFLRSTSSDIQHESSGDPTSCMKALNAGCNCAKRPQCTT